MKSLSVPRTPATASELFGISNRLVSGHIDQHQVGIVADGNASFADQSPNVRRRVAHPTGDLSQAAVLLVNLIEQQRQTILYGGQATGTFGIRQLLLFPRVWSMIGGDDLNGPRRKCLPQLSRIVRTFYGGVHLYQTTESIVVVGREEQVMRTNLSRDHWPCLSNQRYLSGRADMQHVKAMLVPLGQVDRSLSRRHGSLNIANCASDREQLGLHQLSPIGAYGGFVFAMGANR